MAFVAEDYAALSEAATAVLTAVIAWVAWQQLTTIARQQRQSATLDACNRYDSDPVLNDQRSKLERHMDNRDALDATDLALALIALFNYFDAIAIGLAQKLYDEKIARPHLKNVLRGWIEQIDRSNDPEIRKAKVEFFEDYGNLAALYRRWIPDGDTWISTS